MDERSIVSSYKEGSTLAAIAKEHGVHPTKIKSILVQNGCPIRKAIDFPDEVKQEMLAKYLNGASLRSISRDYDTTHHLVSKVIHSLGYDTKAAISNNTSRLAIPIDKINEMIEEYKSGVGVIKLAKKYDIDRHTVTRYIKMFSDEVLDLRKVHIDSEAVIEEYEKTWSSEKAGKAFGISAWSVIKILNDNNVGVKSLEDRKLRAKVDGNGYVYWYDSESPHANTAGRVTEHRYVMGEHLGRRLYDDETVHHIDGNRQNNSIENLQLRKSNHGPGAVYACGDCGSYNIINERIRDS